MQKKEKIFLFVLAFIEGAAVMATELLGAKMTAPFFGTSLYVWASVLGVTLGALMFGYYTGGYLSEKIKNKNLIFIILLLAGFFLFSMHLTGNMIMRRAVYLDIRLGSLISLFGFMFPPLFFMGMSSPVIIKNITDDARSAGKSAGSVYAISTLGGIVATFSVGFYLLPEWGISNLTMGFGFLLSLLPLIALLKNKKYIYLFSLLYFTSAAWYSFIFSGKTPKTGSFKILHESEGIYGQLKVIEHKFNQDENSPFWVRGLLVNNIAQTFMNVKKTDDNLNEYIWFLTQIASMDPPGSKVLLLGLGGGNLIRFFNKCGFATDVVELDKRIKETAEKYFYVSPSENIVIDDARHYIKTTNKKYDIIVIDLFLGETIPSHVFTAESIEEIKKILHPQGFLLFNFYGFIRGDLGRTCRSVYKTLVGSGLQTIIFRTNKDEFHSNTVFLASNHAVDFSKKITSLFPAAFPVTEYIINPQTLDLSDALILHDDIPVLENLYADVTLQWRNAYIKFYTKRFLQEDIRIFR